MTTATAAPPLPAVPLDVLDFAVQQKAAQHIRSVVEIARAVFPSSDIRLYLEADTEIAGERRIIVDVSVTGWSAEDRLQAVLALKLAGGDLQQWIRPFLNDENADIQFEALRWVCDERLSEFLPDVEAFLARSDLDYVRFEAAIATFRISDAAGIPFVLAIGMAFWCPYEGRIDENRVLDLIARFRRRIGRKSLGSPILGGSGRGRRHPERGRTEKKLRLASHKSLPCRYCNYYR